MTEGLATTAVIIAPMSINAVSKNSFLFIITILIIFLPFQTSRLCLRSIGYKDPPLYNIDFRKVLCSALKKMSAVV